MDPATAGSDVDHQRGAPRRGSVVVRVRCARRMSTGPVSFARQICVLFISTICFTIFLGFFMIVPISKLTFGGLFFDDCPSQPLIPVYLLVSGAITCSRDIIGVVMRCILEEQRYEHYHKKISTVLIVVSLGELFIFMGGTYLVFSKQPQFERRSGGDYCAPVLYWFTYWMILASWVLMLMMLCAVMMSMCLFYSLSGTPPKDDRQPTAIVIIPKVEGNEGNEEDNGKEPQNPAEELESKIKSEATTGNRSPTTR